jgi:transcriptional regulator with XRE-family HTH domain
MTYLPYTYLKGGTIMSSKLVNVGGKIKALRENSGFTQSNIAKYLKVDQSLISKVETGERALALDMLEKLAILFGVNLTVFDDSFIGHIKPLTLALRAIEVNEDDLDTISAINRIALNSSFMTQLLEGDPIDG